MSKPGDFAVVILAAGASARLGQPKQLVVFEHETLLDRAVRIAREAGSRQIVVVLGACADRIRKSCRLENCVVAMNADWEIGMGTSIRHGIQSLTPTVGAIIMTCDMPAVTSQHLRCLAASGALTASHYAERRGVPTYFPESMFPALVRLDDDKGARELLRNAPAIELPGGEFDIDTMEHLLRLQASPAKKI